MRARLLGKAKVSASRKKKLLTEIKRNERRGRTTILKIQGVSGVRYREASTILSLPQNA